MSKRSVVSFEDPEEGRPQSKRARKAARLAANQAWRSTLGQEWAEGEANPHFSSYYQAQLPGLRPEWEAFTAAMARPLPVTLRLDTSRRPLIAQALRLRLEKLSKQDGPAATPIVWYPRAGEGFQLAADGLTLSQSAALAPLHGLVTREAVLGHLNRQEAASAIPALLLRVSPEHTVLDMCAAPGSKTEQLLSLLSAGPGPASGMVVANDADPKRISTLRRRYSRSGHPSLLVTNARGEELQRLIGGPVFDRVLCDVPCTGDGTFRKKQHLWRLFRARRAAELHPIQLQLAAAAAALLKPGGRLVYSTCSLNPIENEAVVAALLEQAGGALELEECSQELPGLSRRPGVTHWRADPDVMVSGDRGAQRLESLGKLPPLADSMLPPSKPIGLERCLRIVPHDQDMGGFFVAVIRKLDASRPVGREVSASDSLKALAGLGYNPAAKQQRDQSKPAEYRRLRKSERARCGEQLGIGRESRLWMASDSRVTLVSQAVHSALGGWAGGVAVQAGLPVVDADWRLDPDGALSLLPHLAGVLKLPPADMRWLLSRVAGPDCPPLQLSECAEHLSQESGAALAQLPVGRCAALVLAAHPSVDRAGCTGKQRISKAERKRIKKSGAARPARLEGSAPEAGSVEGLVVVVQREDQALAIVTQLDRMCSFHEALEMLS